MDCRGKVRLKIVLMPALGGEWKTKHYEPVSVETQISFEGHIRRETSRNKQLLQEKSIVMFLSELLNCCINIPLFMWKWEIQSYSVLWVFYKREQDIKPYISMCGTTLTAGWKNPRLVSITYNVCGLQEEAITGLKVNCQVMYFVLKEAVHLRPGDIGCRSSKWNKI